MAHGKCGARGRTTEEGEEIGRRKLFVAAVTAGLAVFLGWPCSAPWPRRSHRLTRGYQRAMQFGGPRHQPAQGLFAALSFSGR